ncbi:MAG: recombinase family protein [Bacteroidaceae bacterium]|nr:recombinase family protein [Bacteroidaceae bacterium]
MYYIYQRVSCDKQSLIRQEGAIGDYCKANNIEVPEENIFSDVITGKTIKRENYQQMKAKLQKEDVLIMLDLDRLGRNWDLIKKEWKELTDKGVYIIIVNCPLINVMPDSNGTVSIDKRLIQEMMFTLLCYVSQREVEKISTRTKESLKAKREQGIRLGKPPKLSPEQRAEIKSLKGIKSCKELGEMYGVNASTISRIK